MTVRYGDEAAWAELDVYVRAYELAHARDRQARIAEFLPAANHPLYFAVLRELVRVDLEYGWDAGCPKSLDDYLAAYPDLKRDEASLRAIVLEDIRLRCQAGLAPRSQDYLHLYARLGDHDS
jgi:hypothetical protein